MTYLLVGLAVALCGLVGYSVYLTRTSEKRFSKQVNLLLTAQHASLSETKSASTKIDWLRYEQDQALEYQKKTFEQQRVLLASLNRQVRRIDDIYKSRPGDAVSSQKPRIPVAKPHPALARQQGQASKMVRKLPPTTSPFHLLTCFVRMKALALPLDQISGRRRTTAK